MLLQMGLNLFSVQGLVVRSVKQWVLKCDACFEITKQMDRMFCPSCGNAALARLGVTLQKNGKPRYHYRRNRRVNTRGTKFALPAPKVRVASVRAGRGGACRGVCVWPWREWREAGGARGRRGGGGAGAWAHSSRLLCWRPVAVRRFGCVSLQGGRDGDLLLREDQLLTGVWGQRNRKKQTVTTMFADCNSADLLAPSKSIGADVVVGFGRRNPNAAKGRERRGAKKKNSRR